MPAKKFQIKLKPKVNVHDFIRTMDTRLITKGNLRGIKIGDVVCIASRGTFIWDGNTLLYDKNSGSRCAKNPDVPSVFLTFDSYPLDYWKSVGTTVMNVRWNRFQFIRFVPVFNPYQGKTVEMVEYTLNNTYKVLSDVLIDEKTPVIMIEKSDMPGYDFRAIMWSN